MKWKVRYYKFDVALVRIQRIFINLDHLFVHELLQCLMKNENRIDYVHNRTANGDCEYWCLLGSGYLLANSY